MMNPDIIYMAIGKATVCVVVGMAIGQLIWSTLEARKARAKGKGTLND